MSSIEPDFAGQQIWVEKGMEYLRYEYPLKSDDIVIDLGSYDGVFAETIHNRYGCHVICVEPTNHIMNLINKPGYTIIKKAAWIRDEVRRFGGAYYHTSAHADHIAFGYNDYDCFDVNGMLEDYEEIGLLKVNIEGDEYPVLEHIMDHVKKIKYLQIQFHVVDETSEAKRNALISKFKLTHECNWSIPFVWESWTKKK